MIQAVLGKPGDGMKYQAPVDFSCIVAVCQSTGAHGVGVCPCASAYPLRGLPSLGEVRFSFLRIVGRAFLKMLRACGVSCVVRKYQGVNCEDYSCISSPYSWDTR